MATRLPEALVAGFGRAPLAIGLAALLAGFASQTVPAENQQFNRATHAQEAELQAFRTPENHLRRTTNSATDQDQDRHSPALASAGMRFDVRSGLPIALFPESSRALNRQMLDDDVIAGIVDSGILQKALRATEIQNLMQPKIDRPQPRANYTQSAPGGARSRPWSLAVSGTAMLWDYDHVTLAAYLPMKGRNAMKKIAEKLFDSKDAGSFVSNMQALSLIARGRINTEFTYSTQFSKHSSLDASAIFRLNANTNTGKSDLVIGLYYRATF